MINGENLVDPQAWQQLTNDHWGRAPVLLRGVCSRDLFTRKSVLEVLQVARQELEQDRSLNLSLYDRDNICRNAFSHSSRANCGLAPLLPGSGDEILETYLSRLSKVPGLDHFTLFMDRPNQFSAEIWLIMRAVLNEFYRQSGLPGQSVGGDIFIGNYKSTPFGVHKDKLHNFMFMAQGRRIMHFWPDREGDKKADEARQISFEVEPGDLLYWPPEYWHVGESSGETAVSINIDIWQNTSSDWAKKSVLDSLAAIADPIAEMLTKRSKITNLESEFPQVPDNEIQVAEELNHLAESVITSLPGPMLELTLTKAWIARLSSAAMDVPVPRCSSAEAIPKENYRLVNGVTLPSLSCAGQYLIGCNGHVLSTADETGWSEIKAEISRGKPFTAEQLLKVGSGVSFSAIRAVLQDLRECRGIEAV